MAVGRWTVLLTLAAGTMAAVAEPGWAPEALVWSPAFSELDSVCACGGRVYVTDKGAPAVWMLAREDGRLLGQLPAEPGLLRSPVGIACGGDRLVVVDQVLREVLVLGLEGSVLARLGCGEGGELAGPQGVALAPDGTMFVADVAAMRIVVLGADGRRLREIDVAGEGGAPTKAESLTVAPDGTLFVAEERKNRVCRFDATGGAAGCFGSRGEGPGRFKKDVEGLAVVGERLLAVDEEDGRVEVFALDGASLGVLGEGSGCEAGELTSPDGISFDPSTGLVWIVDQGNGRVVAFRPGEGR